MKKHLCLLLVLVLTLVPVITIAKEKEKATKIDLKDYNTLNFKETLEDEDMELKFNGYKETEAQTTIYLFRGRGCGFCRSFLTFLNDISQEYGDYFKVVSFETWYDQDNAKLLETVSNFLENPAGGVPYIIIGERVFSGYADSYDEDIKTAILGEFEKEDKYDVIEEYNESIKTHLSEAAKATIWNFFFVLIAAVVIIVYVKKSNEKLLKAINDRPSTRIKETIEKEVEEIKKDAKKVTRKAKKEVKKVVRKVNGKKK